MNVIVIMYFRYDLFPKCLFVFAAKLIEEEGMESGVVSKATYLSYVHYSGGWCTVSGALFFLVLGNVFLVATNAWLAIWLRAADRNRKVKSLTT